MTTETDTKKIPKWAGCFLIFIALSLIGTCVMICNDPAKNTATPEAIKSPDEIRKERIKKAFSAWDGSHIHLENWVKESMNDPDSYEHIETRFREVGTDSVFVIMTFRGKNAFGGVVKNTVTCYTDLDGNLLGAPKSLR